ncbi:MAG: NUDIX domain-containing protein [Herpetosiphonaceae bacterium]|nr:NUDIX domain-containing protein [Herpetosiphonaceae bacterium]
MSMHDPTHRIGAFAVIMDEQGRALISRRTDNGYYNLPGGGVEPDESVTEGLTREIREETGLESRVGRLIGVYSKPQKHEIVLVFQAFITGGTLQTSDEADEHRWVGRDELDSVQLLPKHRERLLDAFRNEAGAVIKDQRAPSVTALKGEPEGGM